jgi:hypothetical protein
MGHRFHDRAASIAAAVWSYARRNVPVAVQRHGHRSVPQEVLQESGVGNPARFSSFAGSRVEVAEAQDLPAVVQKKRSLSSQGSPILSLSVLWPARGGCKEGGRREDKHRAGDDRGGLKQQAVRVVRGSRSGLHRHRAHQSPRGGDSRCLHVGARSDWPTWEEYQKAPREHPEPMWPRTSCGARSNWVCAGASSALWIWPERMPPRRRRAGSLRRGGAPTSMWYSKVVVSRWVLW